MSLTSFLRSTWFKITAWIVLLLASPTLLGSDAWCHVWSNPYPTGPEQRIRIALLAEDQVAGRYDPRIWRLATLAAADDAVGTVTTFCTPNEPDAPCEADGSAFIVNRDFPRLRIFAHLDAAFGALLDGKGPTPPAMQFADYPYRDMFWAVEFKASEAWPTQGDSEAANGYDKFKTLADRSNWHLLEWGNAYGDGAGGSYNGLIEAELDTSGLPEGYYDVRLWISDGQSIVAPAVYYLKVTRDGDVPFARTENLAFLPNNDIGYPVFCAKLAWAVSPGLI